MVPVFANDIRTLLHCGLQECLAARVIGFQRVERPRLVKRHLGKHHQPQFIAKIVEAGPLNLLIQQVVCVGGSQQQQSSPVLCTRVLVL